MNRGDTSLSSGRRWIRRTIGAAILILVVLLPQFATAGQLFFADTVVVAIMFATSTNLLFGQAGIPSFGQAGFFGAGAYAAALAADRGAPVLLSLLLGTIVAALVGLLASLIAWRTTGLAFSMITLAFAQSLYSLAIRADFLGGYNGLAGFPMDTILGIDMSDPGYVWYFSAVVCAVVLAGYWVISRSALGHMLRAMKDDPVRTLFLGVNVRAYRALAFVLAAAGAGTAGALSAYINQVVTPDVLYWTSSATPIMMILLGGMGSFFGPAIGAVAFAGLDHYLSAWTNSYIFYVGVLLYAVLVFLPKGLVWLPATVSGWLGWFTGRRSDRRPGGADTERVLTAAGQGERT